MAITNTIKQSNDRRYVVKIIQTDSNGIPSTQRWKVLTAKDLTKNLDTRDVLEVYELGRQCTLEVTIRWVLMARVVRDAQRQNPEPLFVTGMKLIGARDERDPLLINRWKQKPSRLSLKATETETTSSGQRRLSHFQSHQNNPWGSPQSLLWLLQDENY